MRPSEPRCRSAQMEIMGLVFIVILIVMGLLLLLVFAGRGASTLPRYQESALAKNFLTTLALTQSGCRDRTVEGLIQECYAGTGFRCEDGREACAYAEGVIGAIFDRTLDAWQRNYSLTVSAGETGLIALGLLAEGASCRGNAERAFYHIPYGGTFITMNITLCG